jgi:hypothetical protein
MSPYVHPGPDIDQHPRAIPITIPESPSASTIVSSDTTSINSALSGLSSEILRGSISSPSLGLPDESTDTIPSQSTQLGPFTQHKRFYFEDGNITFLVRYLRRNTYALLISRIQVDGILYRLHRYFFCRDSKIFVTRLSRLPAQEGSESSLPVISLENVKSKDLDAFLSVLYPLCVHWPSNISCNCVIHHLFFWLRNFNALEEHSFEELSSILDLSTRWGFTSIRYMAIRCMEPPTPHERLILGRKYGVDEWIPLALQELCERPQPLTRDEARLMDFEDVVLVGSVREKVRNQALSVDSAGIRDCIEASRRGEPWKMPVGAPTPRAAPGRSLFGTTKFPVTGSAFGAAHPSATTGSGFNGFGGLQTR